MKIKNLLRKYWVTLVGIAVGATIGWLYWYTIGCENGLCTIKSDPWKMTLYGAILGGLFFDMIKGVQWFKIRKDGSNKGS